MPYQISWVNKLSPGAIKQESVADKGVILAWNIYEYSYFLYFYQLPSKLLVDYPVKMYERASIVFFLDAWSIIMPCLELFWLKIRCLLELVKMSWESWILRNGYEIRQQLISSILIGIIGYSPEIFFVGITRRKVNIRVLGCWSATL